MADFFLTLGYSNIRFNIARSGREIDIQAEHRLERRHAIAECKALDNKVGGTEVNAFAGKLRPERRRRPGSAYSAYFISLAGFTEPAKDQEGESGDEAVILVDGGEVVERLIDGRVLSSRSSVASKAAPLATSFAPDVDLEPELDLIAHESGWVWVCYFSRNKQRTHIALVHADGTPLSLRIASEIIKADESVGGDLVQYTCVNPPVDQAVSDSALSEALSEYHRYVNVECGYILLDGLPADAEVGAMRLRLESLFVPLRVLLDPMAREGASDLQSAGRPRAKRLDFGRLLDLEPRLAVLASPGGGKSTLLKRLAVAYSDPKRQVLINDHLPRRDWLPLFFRCRELRGKARDSFPELIDALVTRAISSERRKPFRIHIDSRLRDGRVLLLVDGLDEITKLGDRSAFVRNLRTFLAVYPNVCLVVTSRLAGFRHVAGMLAAVCKEVAIADLTADDIHRLTSSWHREVLGDRPEVAQEASRLAGTICLNNRIRELAQNPLLLTTLLLVKRWVGQLPTKRSVLYGKAVEVLLMTWNVEGHEPIEQDEALPQLCYLAFSMMRMGIRKISRHDLSRLLTGARSELAAELGFARIAVPDFIERIENRSSLLMMTGHDVVDGTLMEFYEFRHATFQEYLAAKAVVEGWYPERADADTITAVLEPELRNEKWREVIPLAAVLAGRKADTLIRRLIVMCGESPKRRYVLLVLAQCIADEVQLPPATIIFALQTLLLPRNLRGPILWSRRIAISKYADVLRDEVAREFLAVEADWSLLRKVVLDVAKVGRGVDQVDWKDVRPLLTSTQRYERCEAGLLTKKLDYPIAADVLSELIPHLESLIFSDNPAEIYAGVFGLWYVYRRPREGKLRPKRPSVERLIDIWKGAGHARLKEVALWAICRLPLQPRGWPLGPDSKWAKPITEELRAWRASPEARRWRAFPGSEVALLTLAFHLGTVIPNNEISAASELFLNSPNAVYQPRLKALIDATSDQAGVAKPSDSSEDDFPA